MTLRTMLVATAAALLLAGCGKSNGEIEVSATCRVPAGLPTASATVMLMLFEHTPTIADRPARLVSRVEARGLALRENEDTEVQAPLRGTRSEQTAYYVVCDAFPDGAVNDASRLFFTDGVVPVLEGRDSDSAQIQLKPVPKPEATEPPAEPAAT